MINKYIFFRTDRIGDFLMSAILIKSIKRSDQLSQITVVASKKNYAYIKNFDFVDEVILFPESYLFKFFFYLKFFLKKFHLIAVLDGKKRSIYFSLITRSKNKFLFTYKYLYKNIFNSFFTKIFYDNDSISKISEIKELLKLLNFSLEPKDLKTINKGTVLKRNFNLPISEGFFLLHLDEKWIFNDYIKNYTSIEPNSDTELISFFEQLIVKSNKDVFISSGKLDNKFIIFIKKNFIQIKRDIYELKIRSNKVVFFDNLNFLQLEKLILNSDLLITCHGAPTHVAASFNIKIIDIIDLTEEIFFEKWSSHFTNYKRINRIKFFELSKNIINLI
tara:strand:+ start:3768 stop:4766 length:999 start_codon:yes stop_codon:yes gene_type:complete